MRTQRIADWPDPAVAALVVALAAVLGVPLGWLWQQLSPRTLAYVNRDGYVIPEETESKIATDGRALIVLAAVGLVIGVALWQWRSRRGVWLLVGAVLGAGAAGVVMQLAGGLISGGRTGGDPGDVFTLPVQITAPAVLVAAPLLALLGHSIGALFIARDDLGRPEGAPEPDAWPPPPSPSASPEPAAP